jgi:hypothetical protein
MPPDLETHEYLGFERSKLVNSTLAPLPRTKKAKTTTDTRAVLDETQLSGGGFL